MLAARRAGAAEAGHLASRHERIERFIEAQLAARLRIQVHRGRPAAVHRQAIALDGSSRHVHRGYAFAPARAEDGAARQHVDAERAQLRSEWCVRLRAEVDQGGDLDAGFHHVARRVIGGIAAGRDHDLAAGGHAIPERVQARAVGEKNPGTIVAGK